MCRSWCASGVVIRIPAGGRLLLPHFAPEVIRSKAGQIFEAAAEMEFIRIPQIAADVFNGPVECFEPMSGQVNLEVVHIGFGQDPVWARKALRNLSRSSWQNCAISSTVHQWLGFCQIPYSNRSIGERRSICCGEPCSAARPRSSA